MKHAFFQKSKLFVVLLFCFLLSACTLENLGDNLKKLDKKIGEEVSKIEKNDIIITDNAESASTTSPAILDKEDKDTIDKLLLDKKLNRYGDPEDTFYAGGTPLYNEITGERTDRYEYILKNHPEFLNELK